MPVAAAIAPIAGSVIGAVAGGANKRPPSLSPQQQAAQNALLYSNQQTATGTPSIDPIQQALLYNNNARNTVGANNQVTNALVSRGLGRSGLLAQGLMNNAAQSSSNQTNIDEGLQQQAVQQKDFANQMVASLLQTPNTPGQSTFGAATAGAAGPLTYALQNYANKSSGQSPANNDFSSAENNFLDTGNYPVNVN